MAQEEAIRAIHVPKELHRRVKVLAAQRGVRIRSIVVAALERELKRQKA